MKLLTCVALGIVVACSDRAAFEPTNPTTRGHAGQPAASYDIRSEPDADPHVRVNVWSRGASVEDGRTMTDVVIEIRNTGNRVIELESDQLRLDMFSEDGSALPPAQLVRVSSPSRSVSVPPGEATTIQLGFALPIEMDPDRIASMRLRWAIDHDDGARYVQFTEFQRVREQYAGSAIYYDPVWGYYDPFLYGPRYLHPTVPVGRVIVYDRDRGRAHVRDHRTTRR